MTNEPTLTDVIGHIDTLTESVSSITETVHDILDTLQGFATHVDGEFKKVRIELGAEIGSIKAQMVTKSYLDDKLADLKGDTVALVRKEDKKVDALVDELVGSKTISTVAAKRVQSYSPFPR